MDVVDIVGVVGDAVYGTQPGVMVVVVVVVNRHMAPSVGAATVDGDGVDTLAKGALAICWLYSHLMNFVGGNIGADAGVAA